MTMSKKLAVHVLKNYGPSNFNTDKFGRNKTVSLSGEDDERLRQSSQNLNSTMIRKGFEESGFAISINTTDIGNYVVEELTKTITEKGKPAKGISEELAKEYATKLKKVLTPKKEKNTEEDEEPQEETSKVKTAKEKATKKNSGGNEEADTKKKPEKESNVLIRLSSYDREALSSLIEKIRGGYKPKDEDFNIYTNIPNVDSMFFGQMDAKNESRNITSAWSQNHPFSVNKAVIETDFFAAQDDLRKTNGAAYLDHKFFSSGLLYSFSVIDMDLLIKNFMIGKEDTPKNRLEAEKSAVEAVKVAVEALIKRSPPGRSTKYADTFSYASYVMIEKGFSHPRSLSSAFIKPVSGGNIIKEAIQRLKKAHEDHNTMESTDVDYVEFERGLDTKKEYQKLFDFIK